MKPITKEYVEHELAQYKFPGMGIGVIKDGEVLQAEGFMARVQQMSRAMSGEENDFEILCLQSEAQEAHQLLIERGLLM